MLTTDQLRPETLKAQCDSAIQILEQENEAIRILQKNLENFIVDDELVSEAYVALKEQISDYLTITSVMITANEYDIEDLNTLKEAVGDEELDGADISQNQSTALSDKNTYLSKFSYYEQKARGTFLLNPERRLYEASADFYGSLAVIAERKYNLYVKKEQKYDEIEAATQNLFSRSSSLRSIAKQGMASITGAFQDGTYHIDMDASWRIDYQAEFNQMIQNTKADFMTTNDAGEQEYNWEYIQEFLERDADEVSEMEYLAFVDLVSEMSPEDLENLLATAQIKTSFIDPAYADFSDVMKTAAGYYLYIAETEAEYTIFDAHNSYDYDEVEITNELSRAELIYQITDTIDTGTYHYIHISENVNTNGKITYIADILPQSRTSMLPEDPESFGEIYTTASQHKIITVEPWGTPLTAGDYLDHDVRETLVSLEPMTGGALFVKEGSNQIINFVVGKIGNKGISNIVMLIRLEQNIEKNYENSVAINGAIDSIDTKRAIVALGINTGIVSITGPTESSIGYVAPKYDPEELLIRVTVYNNENEVPITVEELKEGFETGSQVLEDYMDWYYADGNRDVEEYWIELEILAKDYPETARRMNVSQLQELINKYNDPTYEINAEIMGEQE